MQGIFFLQVLQCFVCTGKQVGFARTKLYIIILKTGRYHGLNPIAGNMLEVLGTGVTLREAAAQISEEYGEDQATVGDDLAGYHALTVPHPIWGKDEAALRELARAIVDNALAQLTR